jgi:hypothetical protein
MTTPFQAPKFVSRSILPVNSYPFPDPIPSHRTHQPYLFWPPRRRHYI